MGLKNVSMPSQYTSLKLVTLLICAETWPRPIWSTVTLGEIEEGGLLGELALSLLPAWGAASFASPLVQEETQET